MVQYKSTLSSTSCALLFMVPNKRGHQNTQRKFALKSKYRPSRSLMLSVIKIEDQILPIRITAKEKKLSVKEQNKKKKRVTAKQ